MNEIKLLEAQAKRRYKNSIEARSDLYRVPRISFDEFFEIVLLAYRSGFKCFYCGRPLRIKGTKDDFSDVFSVDHYIPLNLGGNNEASNLVVCCVRCNLVKGTMRGDTYLRLLSILDKDPEFKERFLQEAYECALARKLERLNKEGLLRWSNENPMQEMQKRIR